MIWLNFLRDLKSTVSRLISVMIITMIAVMVYTALMGIPYNVDLITSGYYDRQNAADYWITGVNLDRGDCRVLSQLPGVTGAQPRVVFDAEARGDSSIILTLYAVPDYSVNTPLIIEGSLPADSREMAVSDRFARAHGLGPGDFYELTLTGTGMNLRLRISGLVKSVECIKHVNASTPTPELDRYAFAYVASDALTPLMGDNRYNQICLTVAEGAGDDALRAEIDRRLGDKVVNVLSRADNLEVNMLKRSTDDLTPVLNLFPVLFFLCAVLLMVSNMSRLIEGSRTTVGTFKALGYSDGTILWYYLLHAVLVVAVGFPLGVLPVKPLIRMIVETLATGNDLPAYAIVYDYGSWLEALAITAVCCVGSAWLVSRSLLKESPAQCMRPKPPGSTKPVLLERLPFLWRRLSFNQKYIIRNTLRNKARMLTCIVGIAFCMALVFAAFALRDAIGHYSDALTANQNKYDLIVELGGGVTEGQYRRLAGLSGVERAEFEMTTACWFYTPSRMTTAMLTVGEDVQRLKLYNPYAPGALELPREGVLLGRNLADELGAAAGDTVTVRFQGDPRYYQIPVAGVDRTITGAIVSRSFWRSLGQAYAPTGAYLETGDRTALIRELERYDFVDAWQTRESVTGAAAANLNSASMVAYILIVFGGGLACVVIYNLGIMSFFEQIRSLATLMVLGFYDREIKRLQLSENIIFAVAGICAGLPMGIGLSYVILAVLKDMPLELATAPASYVLSCAVTMLFALAVNAVIGRKMREIDMLGALKSVE